MRKRCFILGFIGLILGGIFSFLSYPRGKILKESEATKAVLLDMYSTGPFADRDEYERIKSWDPKARKSKFVLGSNISFGVGGVLLILGFIVGPEKKNADQDK